MDEPSDECEHADLCGGCPKVALPYSRQLEAKRARVAGALGRYPALAGARVDATAPAEPAAGYRTRAKLMVGPAGEVGLYARAGDHVVVDVPRCRVLSPTIARVADAVREQAKRGELPRVEAIDVRELAPDDSTRRALVTLVVAHDAAGDAEAFEQLRGRAAALVRAAPFVAGVAVNFRDARGVQVLGGETRLLTGEPEAVDRVGGALQVATFGSFVQAHRGQAARVHALVREAIAPLARPRVLDLYGGSGALALALAGAGAAVHMVERFEPAVRAALEAARRGGVDLTAESGDAGARARSLADAGARFDAVVVNPPRRGVQPEARAALARLGAPLVVYVSCDPDTLARDLDHLARLGYETARVAPLDMIPRTEEVETVVVLRRGRPAPPRVRWEDDDVLVLEKAAHEPLTPAREHEGSLLERARGLAPEATPAHTLDAGTSGLVLFARTRERAPAWQRALAAATARKVYLAAARGLTQTKGTILRDLGEGGGAAPARTRYRRLAIAGGHSVLRVVPEEGRAHQIRRHLAAIEHPVLGDERYGHAPTNRYFEEKHALDRTFLHCVRLELDHPRTGERLVIDAPLPGDLRAVLERVAGEETVRLLLEKQALGAGPKT